MRWGTRCRRGALAALVIGAVVPFAAAGPVPAAPVREADVNLDTAMRAVDELRALGFEVRTTRTTDESVPLGERAAIANRWPADLFVSIHANASTDRSAHGTEAWFQHRSAPSRDLAQRAASAVARRLGTRLRGAFSRLGDHGRDALAVLRRTAMPAVLVETGFLSNPGDASKLTTASGRAAAAHGVVDAVVAHLAGRYAVRGDGPPPPTRLAGVVAAPDPDVQVAREGPGATVRWTAIPGVARYEVWRDGALVRRLVRAPLAGPEVVAIADGPLEPGVHRYVVRAVVDAAGVAESDGARASLTVPARIVVDAGHGGDDPGTLAR